MPLKDVVSSCLNGAMYGFDASMPQNIELAIRLTGSYY